MIVGGHEHFPIAAIREPHAHQQGRLRREVRGADRPGEARPDAPVERFYELIPITSALPDDPQAAAVVNAYESKLGAGLDEVDRARPASRSTAPRRGCAPRETNLGNLVADAVRADARRPTSPSSTPAASAAIASTSRDRSPAARCSRSIRSATSCATLCVPGRVVLAALKHGVSRLPVGRRPVSAGVGPDLPREPGGAGRHTGQRRRASAARRSIRTGSTRWRFPTSSCSAATATRCSRVRRCWSVRKSGQR